MLFRLNESAKGLLSTQSRRSDLRSVLTDRFIEEMIEAAHRAL